MNSMNDEDLERLGELTMSVLLEQDVRPAVQPAAQPQPQQQAQTQPQRQPQQQQVQTQQQQVQTQQTQQQSQPVESPILKFKQDFYLALKANHRHGSKYLERFLETALRNGVRSSAERERNGVGGTNEYETKVLSQWFSNDYVRQSFANRLAKAVIDAIYEIDPHQMLVNTTVR